MQQFEESKTFENEVYFGELGSNVLDTELFNFIERGVCKPVSAKVIISKVTGQHKGFGYASFARHEQAEKAIATLNNQELMGKRVRVMWKNANKQSGEVSGANLFLKNLAEAVTEQDLQDLFAPFGKVVSVKVERYADGKSRGMAYVQLETKEKAEAAIQALDQSELKGKAITVCHHVRQFARNSSPGQEKFTNLFVRGVPQGTDNDKLKELFSKYGEI